MLVLVRQFLLLVLSVSIVFLGIPLVPNTLVYAQDTKNKENTTEVSLDEELNALRDSIYGTRKKNINLDPFFLTSQHVLDTREENLKEVIKEEIEKDYQERLEYYRNEIIAYEKLSKEVDVRLANLKDDTKKDARIALEDLKRDLLSRIDLTKMELADQKEFDPKTGNPLNLTHMINTSLKPQHYWGNKMTIRVKTIGGEKVLDIKQKKFTESLSPRFNIENPFNTLDSKGTYKFSLMNPRGKSLNEFNIAVETVMFFGGYLIFIEKSEMDSIRTRATQTLRIRFIDLNFVRANIGNAPLPVYTFPLKLTKVPDVFSIESGRLRVGNQRLSHFQFGMLAKIHQVIFNMGVAMVDPSTYRKIQPLVESTLGIFGKFMIAQDKNFKNQMDQTIQADSYLKEIIKSVDGKIPLAPDINAEDILKKALDDGKISPDEFAELEKGLSINKAFKDTNAASHQGRKFFNRLRLLVGNLISPRAEGAAKLRNALLVAVSFNKEDRLRVFKDRGGMTKFTKFGAVATGALIGSTFLPAEHAFHISQTLDLLSATYKHFQGYLEHIDYGRNYFELSKDAYLTSTSGVFGGIFKLEFIEPFFSDGKWGKFLLGLSSVLAVTLKFFIPTHITINTYKIFQGVLKEKKNKNERFIQDTEKRRQKTQSYFLQKAEEVRSLDPESANRYKMYADVIKNTVEEPVKVKVIDSFISWADQDNKEYWRIKSDAEKKISGSDISNLTDKEIKLLNEHLQRLRTGTDRRAAFEKAFKRGGYKTGLIKGLDNLIRGFRNKLSSSESIDNKAEKLIEQKVVKDKETFMEAIAYSFLTFSSLKTTFKTLATIWNTAFLKRSNWHRPTMWLMQFIYPNFTIISKGELDGKQHYPTKYNSGLDLWPQKLSRLLGNFKKTDLGEQIPLPKSIFLSKESLDNLEIFEDAAGKLELLAMEIASNKAQKALLQSINDPKRILALFDSKPVSEVEALHKLAKTGINTLHDTKIDKLNKKERAYYRAYYTKTFDLVMQRFISDLFLDSKGIDLTPEQFAKEFVKKVKKNEATDFKFTQSEVAAVESIIEKKINFDKVKKESEQIANNWSKFYEKTGLNFKHRVLRRIHPENPQVKRQQIAGKMLKDSRAMDRAVRMEVNTMLVDIPLTIGMTLLLYSAIPSGLLMPFNPEGLNTETHLNYMSRYLYYNDFIPGMILGLLANTWMKVQMDYRMSSKGAFDKAIMHKDGQKGFWRFVLKNFALNPENTLKENQIFLVKLVVANFPAAVLTTIVFNAYGLGRFDVGSFLVGYTMMIGLFYSGLNFKIENAFENSVSWIYNKIPRKLRAHPEAQSYIDRKLQKKKMVFSWYMQLWTVVVIENVAGIMLTLKENSKIGTRAFIRLMTGGQTFTEIVVKTADMLMKTLESVPNMSKVFDLLKFTVSNNFEAFERYPKELIERGDSLGVKRVYENINLPKNLLAEIIGKLGGAVSTVGLIASMPYISGHLLERYSQSKVQLKGQILKEKKAGKSRIGLCKNFL